METDCIREMETRVDDLFPRIRQLRARSRAELQAVADSQDSLWAAWLQGGLRFVKFFARGNDQCI